MLMAFYLLCLCILLQIVLTLARPKLAAEDPQKLFWEHPFDALKSPGWPGLANYKVLAALVFVVMCVLYYRVPLKFALRYRILILIST